MASGTGIAAVCRLGPRCESRRLGRYGSNDQARGRVSARVRAVGTRIDQLPVLEDIVGLSAAGSQRELFERTVLHQHRSRVVLHQTLIQLAGWPLGGSAPNW